MESLAGKSIGDYKLAEAIGAGSTGEVLKAEDDSGSPHALKVLHQALSLPSRVETYWEEVQMVGVLAHRHITVAKSADWSKSGRFYLSMPLLKGMDLAAVLEKNEKLPAIQAVRLAGQACLALEAAHAEGIVHGALKPSNLFLVAGKDAETFSTRVLDFGTCHLLDPESSNEDGSIVGASNPEYLAPEQLTGEAVKASDVYALAALLCRCLTGRAPITGTRDEIIKALDTVDLSLPDELSEGLTKLLIKALPKKPEDRYADASKLREALEQWAATSPEELTAAPLALFTDLPPSPAAAPTPPPKAAAASGVPKKDAEPAKKTPAPKEPEEEATVEKETKATKKTKASKETKDTSAKSPAAAGSPQDDELAARPSKYSLTASFRCDTL